MKSFAVSLGLIVALAVTVYGQQPTPTPAPAPPKTHLKVGQPAPEFALTDTEGKEVKLSDFKGQKNVVLAFYILAFTGGWTRELKAYQADIAKFEETDTQVIGISMDSSPANKRFAEDIGVKFPLLSDWHRKAVKDYGVYNEKNGYGMRATFVVDKNGIIKHIEEGRSAIDPTGAYQACSVFDRKKKA